MSLVAYGSSGESEDEDQDTKRIKEASDDQNPGQLQAAKNAEEKSGDLSKKLDQEKILTSLPAASKTVTEEENNFVIDSSEKTVHGLFSVLPTPKTSLSSSAAQVDKAELLLSNKQSGAAKRQPVRITVPSLSEFDDDDDEESIGPKRKKVNPSAKGSGLFAVLPAPKNLTFKEAKRALVPHAVSKNTKAQSNQPKPQPAAQTTATKPPGVSTYAESDESDVEDGAATSAADFFSLSGKNPHKNLEIPDVPLPSVTLISNDGLPSSSSFGIVQSSSQIEDLVPNEAPVMAADDWVSPSTEDQWQVSTEQPSTSSDELVPDSTASIPLPPEELGLTDEALVQLCGRRGKRNKEDLRLIDVSGDNLIPDSKEWLLKQLSEEQPRTRSHSHRKNDGPTTQQRRKHQITYLAFQAKENELELKNQWAQNRMSRKQTQSKYGF